jgi:hypothetical protein
MTGAEIIDLERLRGLIATGTAGWMLCDRQLLLADNKYLSEPLKAYLREFAARAAVVGQDGVSFAVPLGAPSGAG